jgi:hypothetical protein
MAAAELTVAEKKEILEEALKNLYKQIYDLTMSCTIANRVENPNAERIQKQLELATKTKDEYEKELKEV